MNKWLKTLSQAEYGSPEGLAIMRLAHVVVSETCRDYLKAYRKSDPKGMAIAEKLLRSTWYRELGVVNPDYIMEKLKRDGMRGRNQEGVSLIKNRRGGDNENKAN